MYCKFCGSTIASDATKCLSCGAEIDLTDGGQSFFEDYELDAWQSDIALQGPHTSMPKTEMRPSVSLPQEGLVRQNNENVPLSRVRKSKKKAQFGFLKLSSSNKLIIFCIATALAIVLLAVAIISVLNQASIKVDEDVSPTPPPEYYQTSGNEVTEKDEARQEKKIEKSGEENEALKDKTEIKYVKIYDKDGKEIPYDVAVYLDKKDTIYVSIDKFLKHEGYKSGKADGKDSSRVLYEHKTNGKTIEIKKGTNKLWITEHEKKSTEYELDEVNFNVGNNTYVPIESFLDKYGYDSKIKWNEKEKKLYFNK